MGVGDQELKNTKLAVGTGLPQDDEKWKKDTIAWCNVYDCVFRCVCGGGGVIVYIAVWIMSASDASEMLKLCPGLK